MGNCKDCKHWLGPVGVTGVCTHLKYADPVTITIAANHNTGAAFPKSVDNFTVRTARWFGCVLFEQKEGGLDGLG